MHVELEDAPLAALEVPAGQSCGLMLERAHQAPCGHKMGVPLAQKYEVGQGTQVRARIRWFHPSEVYRIPDGLKAKNIGILNAAETPNPFA